MWKKLPDSELEIMMVIWQAGEEISTSDMMQRLKDKKSVQLVQSYLSRLEGKGYIRCNKIGRLNHYTPLVSLEEYQKNEVASFVEKLYQNSPAKLFSALLETDKLTEQDIADIRAMLDRGEK